MPLAGATALAIVVPASSRVQSGILAFAVLVGGAAWCRRLARHAALMALVRIAYPCAGALVGVAGLAFFELLTGHPLASARDLGLVLAVSMLAAFLWPDARQAGARTRRVAFIGGAATAGRLEHALQVGGSSEYVLVGRIATGPTAGRNDDVTQLGTLEAIGSIVSDHRIDVLALGFDAPRQAVFARIAESCLHLPVQVVDLAALYEEVFGHVPMAEIDASWFQCLADPRVRRSTPPLKRAMDVTCATLLGFASLPIFMVVALLVRADGGPWLFAQVRIGEGGRPFRLYKVRTMRPGSGRGAQWAELDDPRITRIGKLLRRTHLDELPQLINVIRGEMSLVGPRPEQPEFVDRLERSLPFYQRRHLSKPGITGWAQIRCGYAGSDVGSAWKLSHDLYYLKHRSVGLDALILIETLATLIFDRQPVLRPQSMACVLGEQRPEEGLGPPGAAQLAADGPQLAA
jgi:exopolysaccharide biosynthesis polyprenyl glycosylphosphotransferase